MEVGPEIWGPIVGLAGFLGSRITAAAKSSLVQDQAKRIKALEDARSEALARQTETEQSSAMRIGELERQVAVWMQRLTDKEAACEDCSHRIASTTLPAADGAQGDDQ